MKKKAPTTTRTVQEPLHFTGSKERIDPFRIEFRIPGVDIPGYGGHYPSLVMKGPMGSRRRTLHKVSAECHDPCFWNPGGGRWFHTQRRGGVVGRQRERALPRNSFPK